MASEDSSGLVGSAAGEEEIEIPVGVTSKLPSGQNANRRKKELTSSSWYNLFNLPVCWWRANVCCVSCNVETVKKVPTLSLGTLLCLAINFGCVFLSLSHLYT